MTVAPRVLDELRCIVGRDGVVSTPGELVAYECDAYTLEKLVPAAVVLPRSTDETAAVVKALAREQIPFVPRGAGTNLSGGTLALSDAIMIAMTRMNQILSIDVRNRRAVVQAGVVNMHLTRRTTPLGYHYAPDPSSQSACTIGGNVAENSGGPHTLKYGVTTNHVLGFEMVLPDGRIVHLGRPTEDAPGYDLRGLALGSEGTFGLVTSVTVRLTPLPRAARTLLGIYDSVDAATRTVASITSQGILPAALEMMDQLIIQAVEDAFHPGFPKDAQALLIIELDGLPAGLDAQADRVEAICHQHGARSVRRAAKEEERAAIWQARKKAIGAIGRITPSFCTQDGVIPRTRLPEVLRDIAAIGLRYGLRIANVFHAGDGNLHPILLFDERQPDQVKKVLEASTEILQLCLRVGGTLTGEHGIGIEKMHLMREMFSPDDLRVMRVLRGIFNPSGLCNPGKVLPADDLPVAAPTLSLRKVQGYSSAPVDFQVQGCEPTQVWEPGTVGELLEMTSRAARDHLAVIPWGGGTHMHLGYAPSRYDVALSMRRLTGVVEYLPDDLVLTVRAGTTLDALDAVVKADGLRLACDPPHGDRVTVGGLLASNASGPLRHAYGTPRDLVLGVKVAMAGGTEVKGGGRVVKNVTGYDVVRLMVGSLGTLGAIFEATFKLVPRPAAVRTLKCVCTGAKDCEALLARLSGADFAPSFVELRRHQAWEVYVGLEGEPELLEAQTQQLGEATSAGLPPWESTDTVIKVSVLPGDLVSYIEQLPPHTPIAAAAGVGVLYACMDGADRGTLEAYRTKAENLGGTLVVERAPAALKAGLDVWGDMGDSLPLMRAVKETLDPHGVFSPGRFVDRP